MDRQELSTVGHSHSAETAYIDKKQVARMLGITPRTVDRLRVQGTLNSIRIGGLIRFNAATLQADLAAAQENSFRRFART